MREAFKIVQKLGLTRGVELGSFKGENATEVLNNIPIKKVW